MSRDRYGSIMLANPTSTGWRQMLEECDVEPLSMQTLYRGEILRRLLESGAANLDYVREELLRRHGHCSEKDFHAAVLALTVGGLPFMKVLAVSQFALADLPRLGAGI